jgi:aryl-alcohol dehydrogenase-like predicted oxidoreductase
MRKRPLGTTGIELSEIGFGVWTITAGWWGKFTPEEATELIRAAYDAGITFFNTGNVYGEAGYGERIVAEALADVRDQVVIATTFGYDVEAERPAGKSGHAERPHDWSAANVRRSLEASLENLQTDCIDVWQLHNPRMDAMTNDALWTELEAIKAEGLVQAVGPSIGPAIGWRDEALFAIRERPIDFIHHIYNLLEQDPGRDIMDAAGEREIGVLARVPHSSGLLEDKFTLETTFDASDHRSHRKREWLVEGLQKIEAIRFLVESREGATMGQVALKWLLADPAMTSVQPNIMDLAQIAEFTAAPDIDEFDADELGELDALYHANFGVELATPAGASS